MTIRFEPAVPSKKLLDELLSADPADRERLADEFMRAHDTIYKNIARGQLHAAGLTMQLLPDAHQTVVLVAWKILADHFSDDPRRRKLKGPIPNWPGYVKVASRRPIADMESTHAFRRLSMQESSLRRRKRFTSMRFTLEAKLGRTPSDDEVIEFANKQLERHKDPSKSANLRLTKLDADRMAAYAVPMSAVEPYQQFGVPADFEEVEEPSMFGDDGYLLAPGEAPEFLERVYNRIRKRDGAQAGRIAKALLLPLLQENLREEHVERQVTRVPTVQEIAEAEGLPVERVREVQASLRPTAMAVLDKLAREDPEFRERLERFKETVIAGKDGSSSEG